MDIRGQAVSGFLLLSCLLIACEENPPTPEIPPEYLRDCGHFVFFEADNVATSVSVVGAFNGWAPGATTLGDGDGDRTFVTRLTLSPGDHLYGIDVDGELVLDRFNPLTGFDSAGQEFSLARIEDCRSPALSKPEINTTAQGHLSATFEFLRGSGGAPVDLDTIKATLTDAHPISIEAVSEPGDITISADGLPRGKHWLKVEASDTDGNQVEVFHAPFWIEEAPFVWEDALIYQIVVDRFRKGGGQLAGHRGISMYHDGDLHGVVEAIEEGYFESLGINTLWLSPLYDNPDLIHSGRDGHDSQAYHGYWPAAPRSVEPRFGGEAAVVRLVEAAHARGMRVIMDVVLNHVHEAHPYALQWGRDRFNNPDGECLCGLTCPWQTHIEDCWFDPFLPDLNLKDPSVLAQLVEDALFWIERFDLDGLRVDAVPMMPRTAIRSLRNRLQGSFELGGTHHFLLGETFTGRGDQGIIRYYLGEHSLSGQFDFPLMWALRAALAGRSSFVALDTEVLAGEAAWRGSGATMAPIIGNHDVPRFISDVNGDQVYQPRSFTPVRPPTTKPYEMLKMAWAFLLTQPGAPVVYYGDEFGLPGANDPDNRRDMVWGGDLTEVEADVLEHVQRLGLARRCSEALRRGTRETLFVHEDLYIYGRDAQDGRPALIVLNRSDEETMALELDIPEGWALDQRALFEDLFGALVSQEGRRVVFSVPPQSAAVLLTECVE